ncbi:hypothetical protein [Caldilinea sp.]|nr:hypothetical protein [Caldilinea sp.]HRA67702.1 hypothetical protein [Caldilinea sp.]
MLAGVDGNPRFEACAPGRIAYFGHKFEPICKEDGGERTIVPT